MQNEMDIERAQGLTNSNGMKWVGKPLSLSYHSPLRSDDFVVEEDPFQHVTPPPAVRVNPPTEAQISFALSLLARKGGGHTEDSVRAMDRRSVSTLIDTLKKTPDAPKTVAATVTEGMYRNPATGDIFKVQVAHHGSGNLYAKRLVKLDEPKIKRSKEYSYEFEYAPGALKSILPEWKMTLEEAKEWGALYGACCNCGTVLTDEKSIAAGIGPICAGKF
jgi:hypothetical protein